MAVITRRPPAISGVSSSTETQIQTIFPSIGGTSIGKLMGMLYDSIPIPIGSLKLSHLIFPLPTAPLAVLVFFYLKIFGEAYVLTNRSMRRRSALGNRLIQKVLLNDIEQVVVDQKPGQAFYPAGDILLLGKKGETLMTLAGVSRPDVFRQSILEARDARRYTEASLATISARGA